MAAFAVAYSSSFGQFALFHLLHGAFYTVNILENYISKSLFQGSTMVAWVTAYEHSSTGLRGFTTFIFGLTWVIGYCAVAPIAQLSDSWRELVALAGIPILVVFLLSAV